MKTYPHTLLLLLSLFLAIISCNNKQEEQVQESVHEEEEGRVTLTSAQLKNVSLEFGKIEMKNLSNTIAVNGLLDVPPQKKISVSAMMGGFIKSTDLLQGLVVKKGQVIATIQNPDFIQVQREYLEQKEKLTFLEQEYKRQEELSKENVAASKIFQQVSAEYNSLQVSIGALEERLKMLNIPVTSLNKNTIRSVVNIYAPISGHVTTVNVNLGTFVNPQDVICEIVDTDHLHAELTVFEKDILKVKIGQKIRFVLVNEGNKERIARVYLINRQISEDRTIRVHAHLEKEDATLIPNMFLKAYIETGEGTPVTALPEQAVVNMGDKYYIFIKEGPHSPSHHQKISDQGKQSSTGSGMDSEMTFSAIEIKKGITQNGFTEIDLPPGYLPDQMEVVVKGAFALLAKMNVGEEEGHAH